jgi:hypothetical protein
MDERHSPNIATERPISYSIESNASVTKRDPTMKQSTVIDILLGAAVLPAIALLYFSLAAPGQLGLSSGRWALFAAIALALIVAAFAPSAVRRLRGLSPPQPLSPSHIRFAIAVSAILVPLAFFAVWEFGPLGSLVIMLVPIAFMLRFPRNNLRNTNE